VSGHLEHPRAPLRAFFFHQRARERDGLVLVLVFVGGAADARAASSSSLSPPPPPPSAKYARSCSSSILASAMDSSCGE
jgi:hypothetical protein